MNEREYLLSKVEPYGYYRLDPIPTEGQLQQFYQQEYYKKVRMKGATSVGKLAHDGSNERQNELEWLQKTRYLDIADTLFG